MQLLLTLLGSYPSSFHHPSPLIADRLRFKGSRPSASLEFVQVLTTVREPARAPTASAPTATSYVRSLRAPPSASDPSVAARVHDMRSISPNLILRLPPRTPSRDPTATRAPVDTRDRNLPAGNYKFTITITIH